MVDSIIFDLDGTLWDSSKVISRAWNQSGLLKSQVNTTTIKSLMGKTNQQICELLDIDEEILGKLQNEELLELTYNPSGVKLYDPQWVVIRDLSSKYQLFINSNCQPGYIESFINLYRKQARQYITSFLHSTPTCTKSQNLGALIKTHNLKNPVVVGDTESDYQSAVFNDAKFIWAAYGFGAGRPEYQWAIPKLRHLPNIIGRI